MSTINYLTVRNSLLTVVNAANANYSTLTGSSITVLSTMTTSTLLYSTLRGSTMTGSIFTLSSLTVSSINGAVPGTGTATSTFSTLIASSIIGTTMLGQNITYPNRFVELGTDAANSMYLDFHSSDAALPDYSSRIQSLGGATTGTGILNMTASTIGLITNAGVGIGTGSPSNTLHIYTSNASPLLLQQSSTSQNYITFKSNATVYGYFGLEQSDGTGLFGSNTGYGMSFGTPTATNINVATNNVIRMTVTSGGNVGIGTTVPDYKLKIEQGFGNNSNGLFISNTNYGSMQGLNISMVNAGSSNLYSYAAIQGYTSGVAATTNLILQPTAGYVGIGTASPGYALDAVGVIRATTGLYAGNGTGAVGLNLYDIPAAAWQITTGGYNLSINNNSASWTNRVTINQSGQVGIGTASPSTALTVNGTISTPGYVDVTSDNPGDLISKRYTPGTGDRYGMGQYSGGITRLFTSGAYASSSIAFSLATDNVRGAAAAFTDLMYITHAGNVGIGTATPGYPLDVNGKIRSTQTALVGFTNVVHRRMIWGQGAFTGSNFNSFTSTTDVSYILLFLYGPFGYGLPGVATGATRYFRLYVNWGDNFQGGQWYIDIKSNSGTPTTVTFTMGTTWGGPQTPRDGYSDTISVPVDTFNGNGFHANVYIRGSTTNTGANPAQVQVNYIELQALDQY